MQYFRNEILNGKKLFLFGADKRSSAVVSTLREYSIEPYCICVNSISKWEKEWGKNNIL